MRYLDRGAEPWLWTEFKKRNKRIRYDDLELTSEGRDVRREMREYLVAQQFGLCAYCCGRISADGSHSLNEHIRPRSSFPNETMDYSNLVASCVSVKSCGQSKGNNYFESFVSPLQLDCAEHFRFYPDGSVEGVDQRGKDTCDLLQLNCHRLREARRAMLESLSWADEGYVREYCLTPRADGRLEQFADMLTQMCDDGFFDRAGTEIH